MKLPADVRNQFLNHQDWFNFFGSGEEGWNCFVDYYHFNLYVNNTYEVKDLFAPYEQYNQKDCTEVVGTYSCWDYCLPDAISMVKQFLLSKQKIVPISMQ